MVSGELVADLLNVCFASPLWRTLFIDGVKRAGAFCQLANTRPRVRRLKEG